MSEKRRKGRRTEERRWGEKVSSRSRSRLDRDADLIEPRSEN